MHVVVIEHAYHITAVTLAAPPALALRRWTVSHIFECGVMWLCTQMYAYMYVHPIMRVGLHARTCSNPPTFLLGFSRLRKRMLLVCKPVFVFHSRYCYYYFGPYSSQHARTSHSPKPALGRSGIGGSQWYLLPCQCHMLTQWQPCTVGIQLMYRVYKFIIKLLYWE